MEESTFLFYLKTKPLHEYYHAFIHMKNLSAKKTVIKGLSPNYPGLL